MAVIEDNIYDESIHKELENYTFDGTKQLKNHEWFTSMSAYDLAKAWDEQELIYYPDIQRGVTTQRDRQGNITYKAIYSKKNVKEIQGAILNGTYFPDTITLNIIGDESNVEYDQSTLSLHVTSGLLCILDGQHRIKALHKIYQDIKKSNGEFYFDLKSLLFPIKITNYDKDTASQQFYQYTRGLKISTSRAESFNREEAANRIVSELNKHGALAGMIDATKNSIAKTDMDHIVTFGTLVTAIRDSFGLIKDEKTEKDYLTFLQVFFRELTSIFPEMLDYKKRELSKENLFICENFMFYGYVHLAKQLYMQRLFNWKEQLRFIEKVDFSKESLAWEDITRRTKKGGISIINNKTTRQALRDALMQQLINAQNDKEED